MTHKNAFLVWLSFVLAVSCQNTDGRSDQADLAAYYFEFDDEVNSDQSNSLIEDLSSIFVTNDYIITQESADKGWPYWDSLAKGDVVSKDSLMFPHTTFHRLIPITELKEKRNTGVHEFRILFKILAYNEKEISLYVEIYNLSVSNKTPSGIPGASKFGAPKSYELLLDQVQKTLIRDTFK